MRKYKLVGALVAALACSAIGAGPASAAGSTPQWIDGTIAYAGGTSCGGPLVGNYWEYQVGGYTGYFGAPDASYPKIGDRYFGHIYYTSVGLGCGLGIHGIQAEIALPRGTSLAINGASSDVNDKIRCYRHNLNGTVTDVTNAPWVHPDNPSINGKYCGSTETFAGPNGTILSYALLAQGQSLEIIFPLRSTVKLAGIAEPQNAARMNAYLTDSSASSTANPYQWNFVGDRPVEADCPAAGATAASAITDTTAHTRNFMCNWYRSGKASIEIGEGATGPYQASTQQYTVNPSFQGFYIDQDWNNLTPGTTYHWRLKFVDDKGTTTTADDVTHFSNPRTFTTTGTRPAGPSTTPGAGSGGTGSDGGQTGGQTPGSQTGGDQQQQQQLEGQQQEQQQQQQQREENPPKDTTAPGLTLSFGKLKLGDLVKKGLPASVTCSEGCTVHAQLQIDAKTAKKLKLGKRVATIGQGKAAGNGKLTVPVKLTAKAKKALKRARSLKVTLVVTATDAAGNASAPVKKSVTLRR